MGLLNPVLVEEIKARRNIKEMDVERIRHDVYSAALMDDSDVDALFAINASCPIQTPSWPSFFIEAVCDYILDQVEPHGYLTVANAAWLTGRIASNGRIARTTELELLVTVIEKARWLPCSLSAFAIEQVKLAVLMGDGPIRANRRLEVGSVTEPEVDLMRRILIGFGGQEPVAVSRAEVEMLLDIEEATQGGDNHPAWNDLLVKAMASAIMSASGYAVPRRDEALRRDQWLTHRGSFGPEVGRGAALTCGLARVFAGYRAQTPEQKAMARLEQQRREIITSERVTEGEPGWLVERIGEARVMTKNARALLAFLKAESPSVHPALRSLVEMADLAA